MKYRKINEATVQCIITEEDMLEYGLTLSDIFERNPKGEEFLRDVIERAHEEVGYKINSGNIAMQITPLKDKGMVLTFTDDSPAAFRDILSHLKEVLQDVGAEITGQGDTAEEKNATIEKMVTDYDENRRMIVFASMHQAMRYAACIPTQFSVKSTLYEESGVYYLLLEKGRISYKNFNKISALALEFGNLVAVSQERMNYLEEHGACLITERAVNKLRKVYLA